MLEDTITTGGSEPHVTAPKPFVFVLMPFSKAFNDVYRFGIKGAADEVGAYAENSLRLFHAGSIKTTSHL